VFHLQNLRLFQYKNYKDVSFTFCPHINCLLGHNGAGKTNVLDAIYYLSFTKSYFQTNDLNCVMQNKENTYIVGSFVDENIEKKVELSWGNTDKKKLKVNNNDMKRYADHIGRFPVVIITPFDILLILEGSEERRKWIDSILCQTNKLYLDTLMQYNRLIEQRNKLLKNHLAGNTLDPLVMESYDEQLTQKGTYIFESRLAFIHNYVPIFQSYYNQISENQEVVKINYISHLQDNGMADLLNQNRIIDLTTGRTNRGIHKDEFDFLMNDRLLKKHASQGQQKSYIIAMKLAQYEYLQEHCNIKPILLLDDIFEKLDAKRMHVLLNLIASEFFGQIFITDTHQERSQNILSGLATAQKYFMVNNGLINEI
jgi:DNA replication and repair protein RecF